MTRWFELPQKNVTKAPRLPKLSSCIFIRIFSLRRSVVSNLLRYGIFSLLMLVATQVSAQPPTSYVPRYFTYQLNGVYYFYCTKSCTDMTPSMQCAPRMHAFGC